MSRLASVCLGGEPGPRPPLPAGRTKPRASLPPALDRELCSTFPAPPLGTYTRRTCSACRHGRCGSKSPNRREHRSLLGRGEAWAVPLPEPLPGAAASFYATVCADRPSANGRKAEAPLLAVDEGSGTGQKCVSSPVADDVARPPANGRKAEAPLPAVETRHCEACDADFRPARPWSRFCGPACRLRGYRRLAGHDRAQNLVAVFEGDSP